jgi:mycothiol system anti-sigma-R factor
MLERYKTLGAMLALGEFTVADLAVLSGVGEPTVRTILRRDAEYIEQLGSEPTGRPGGQPVRWRLRSDARERLRGQLGELERLGIGPWLGESHSPAGTLPPGLVAAEDVLLRLVPAAPDFEERAELLQLARAQLDAADATALAIPDTSIHGDWPAVSLHRRIVELLLDLEEAEQLARQGEHPELTVRVEVTLTDLLLAAGKADDDRLTGAIRQRIEQSPFSLFRRDPGVDLHRTAARPIPQAGYRESSKITESSADPRMGSGSSEMVGPATALTNLALNLEALGRYHEALVVGQEAADLWRPLAVDNPACQPGLAFVLTRLSADLEALGHHHDALAIGREAADLWRSLSAGNPVNETISNRDEPSSVPSASSEEVGTGSRETITSATQKISCAEVLDRVYSYLDGELDESTCEAIREHLDECGRCLREYGLEDQVRRLVRKHCGHDEVPREMQAKLRVRIRDVQSAIRTRPDY